MLIFKYWKALLHWKTLLFLFVLYFTVVLYSHDYDRYPFGGHGEEQAYAWAGISLLRDGVPTSWTHFDYPEENKVFKGKIANGGPGSPELFVELVTPWFDHPPLYYTLMALKSYKNGDIPTRSILAASHIRLPSVIAFWLTLVVVFLLAWKLFGYWTGLLSMLFMGTTPLIVFAGRLAVPEVPMGLFLVLMLLLFYMYEKKNKLLWILPLPIIAGIAGLMKFTGFFLLPLFVFFLLRKQQWKRALLISAMLIPFVAGVFWWGAQYDLDLFIKLVQRQAFRPIGWTGLPFLFSSPGFDVFNYFDGWYVLSLISVVFLYTVGKKEHQLVLWGIFYWFAVVIFTGGQQDMLPWYRYPVYPLLSISLALFIRHLVSKPNFFSTIWVVGMLLSSRHYLANAFRSDILPLKFRIIFSSLLAPSLLMEIDKNREDLWRFVTRAVLIGAIIVGIFLNTKYIYGVFPIRCEHIDCTFGPETQISAWHFPFVWRFLLPKPL